MLSPFPCSPVIRECLWNKTQIEKQTNLNECIRLKIKIDKKILYSCIDLSFTSKLDLTVEPSFHPSLHLDCHHRVVFPKFDLNICYPPPSDIQVIHYKFAGDERIRKAVSLTGKKPCLMLVWMKKLLRSIRLFQIFWVTIPHLRQRQLNIKL